MRKIRGDRIAMVFQEPMTALNPVFTVGDQIAEVVRVHTDDRKQERGRARSRCSRRSASRRSRSSARTSIRISSRAACGSAS